MDQLLDELGIPKRPKSIEQRSYQGKFECDKLSQGILDELRQIADKIGIADKFDAEIKAYQDDYDNERYLDAVTKIDGLLPLAQQTLANTQVAMKKGLEVIMRRDGTLNQVLYDAEQQDAFGKPKLRKYKTSVTKLVENWEAMNDSVVQEDYIEAMKRLSRSTECRRELYKTFESEWTDAQKWTQSLDKGIRDKVYRDFPDEVEAYQTAKKNCTKDIGKVTKDMEWNAASVTAILSLERAIDSLRQGQAKRLKDKALDGKPTKALVEEARKIAAADPHGLDGLGSDDDGRALLDRIVEHFDDTALLQSSKEVVAAAIRARFGVASLTGDLTKKALPKLYELFKMVPLTHTLSNEKLLSVKRDKKSSEASFYRDSGIVLNLKASSGRKAITDSFDQDPDVDVDCRITEPEVSYFNSTTLHEIGHAVDDMIGFMRTRGNSAEYGGWQTHKVGEVAEIALKEFGVVNRFPTADRKALLKFIEAALEGKEKATLAALNANATELAKDPALAESVKIREKKKEELANNHTNIPAYRAQAMKKCRIQDPNVQRLLELTIDEFLKTKATIEESLASVIQRQLITTTSPPDWNKLTTDPIVEWCRNVRLNGGQNGLWRKKTQIKDYALENKSRVYQESYEGKWVSYLLAARAQGVSSYQFRADGEWFSELYAAFYQQKLPPTHPHRKWLEDEVDKYQPQ